MELKQECKTCGALYNLGCCCKECAHLPSDQNPSVEAEIIRPV